MMGWSSALFVLEKYRHVPEFETEERTFAARLLHKVLLLSLGVVALLLVVMALLPQNRAYNLATVSIGLVNFLAMLWLLQKGHLMIAGWYYLSFFWLFITTLSATVSGIFSPHLMLYVILIVLASILLKRPHARAFTALCVGSLVVFALNWQHTDVTFDGGLQLASQRAAIYLLLYSALFVLLTMLIESTTDQIQEYLTNLREKETMLSEANRQLVAEVAQHLQTAVRLQESEARFRQIFDAAPIGILIISADQRVTDVNQAMVDMFAYDAQTFAQLDDIQTSEIMRVYNENVAKLLSGEVSQITFENRPFSRNGKQFWVQVTGAVVCEDKAPSYVILMLQDITAAKESEQRQIALAVERERIEFLREFTRHMTHDLKTPLASIRSSAYLLRAKATLGEHVRYVVRIEGAVDTLVGMVDNILATLRLEHIPQLDVSLLDMDALMQGIHQQMQSSAEQKRLHFAFVPGAGGLRVVGDADQLAHALVNVVQNAIKYTPDGGSVTLSTLCEADEIVISVVDTGIGMAHSDLERIFEPFYRTHNARNGYVGTGLGLSIVKKVVELHAGTIAVTSAPDEGTTFRIALPAHTPQAD